MGLKIVILAAGQGKRMHSKLPKVMHPLAGKPMLAHIIETILPLSPEIPIVVYAEKASTIPMALKHYPVSWIEQREQLGTAHALLQALPAINDTDRVLVLYGDVPLITATTLKHLLESTPIDALGLITAHLANPTGYGRILRDAQNKIIRVVEEKDASLSEKSMTEINTGIYLVQAKHLKQWLPKFNNHNLQKEYYLTDIIAGAVQESVALVSCRPQFCEEILGVNDCSQLAYLERIYQRRYAETLMRAGVTILDPERLDIRGDITIGQDVVIDINVILEGTVIIGDGCKIGPFTLLRDVCLGQRVEIKAHSVIEGAKIADEAQIGPFARIRPKTEIAAAVHIGNFVEIKNSVIGNATKINHLSYIGDSEVGQSVNIGAGTITCNYDGVNKHKTIIGDYVFIGSSSQLVAPIIIGEGATIGAGSTLTRNAPPYKLTLARVPQATIEDWVRPKKVT